MLLGRDLPRPGEWTFNYGDETQDRVDSARQCQAALATVRTASQSEQLRVGELVLARNFAQSNAADGFNAQLAPRWTGPFPVFEKCSDDVYILERPGRDNIKLHISALKRVPQIQSAEAADAAQLPIDEQRDTVSPPPLLSTSPVDTLPQDGLHDQPSADPASDTASTVQSTRAQSTPADTRAASAGPPIRAHAEEDQVMSSAQRLKDVKLPADTQTALRRESAFQDFAAVAAPRRRRGRPSKEELEWRAVERDDSNRQHRYNLRPRRCKS